MGDRWSGIRKLLRSNAEVEAEDLRKAADKQHCKQLTACRLRTQVEAVGVIRSATFNPQSAAPTFEAELYDGSTSVRLIFLGQRRVAGIQSGSHLKVKGLLTEKDGTLVIYNPAYELSVNA